MNTAKIRQLEQQAYMDLATQAEERRDNSPFEGEAYWKWHEIAMFWNWKAEQFMPLSGRTISEETFR